MKDKDTPLALVRLWPKMLPDAYDQLDWCKAAKDDGKLSWPDYCLLPINAAFTYLVSYGGLTPEQAASVAAELTACWTWRQNKVIYWVNEDLASVLAEQAQDMTDADVLPVELLMHLPYPCIYVKVKLVENFDGFWAWVDFDLNRGAPELRLQFVNDDMSASVFQVLHLLPGATLGECIADTINETAKNIEHPVPVFKSKEIANTVLAAVQIILYIVSENAEIEDEYPLVKSRERKKIEDKAGEIDLKIVGVRMGAAIRRAKKRIDSEYLEGTGRRVRPHARRGHWHHYWTGPKNGDRKLILKWTAPTMIHPEEEQEDNIVVFPIK